MLSCFIAVVLLQFSDQCVASVFPNHTITRSSEGFCHRSDAPRSSDTRITLCNSFLQLGKRQIQVPSAASTAESDGDTDVHESSPEKLQSKDPASNISAQVANTTKTKSSKKDGSNIAAKLVVAFMLAGIVIVAIVMAMTHSSDLHLSSLSTFALETTLSFFLGVLWFQALRSLIETIKKPETQVVVSVLNAIFWLLLFLVLAWIYRSKAVTFATITGCCAYIAAFFATHAAYISQKVYYSQHWTDCLHGLFVLLVVMGIIFSLCYLLKVMLFGDYHDERSDHDVNEGRDATDNMLTVFLGMAAAFALTEFIRFLIAGEFPQPKGMDHNHTKIEKHMLLGWVVAIIAIGGFIVWNLAAYQEFKRPSYGTHLLVGVACSFFSMCIAWAVLDWGQWYMYEWVHLGPIFSRVVFALICTGVWIVGVWVLAAFRTVNPRFCHYFVLVLALLSAWSWGQVLDYAFDRVFEWGAKVFAACIVSALIVPTMALLLKPIARYFHPVCDHFDHAKAHHVYHEQPRHMHLQHHEQPRHMLEPRAHGMGWSPPVPERRLVDPYRLPDTRARLASPLPPLQTSPFMPEIRAPRVASPIRNGNSALRTNPSLPAAARTLPVLPATRMQGAHRNSF